ARVGGHPAGEERLLLIATGELGDGHLGVAGLDAQGGDVRRGDLFLTLPRQVAEDAALHLQRENDVLAQRELADDPFQLAVLGTEADAAKDRLHGRGDLRGPALDEDGSLFGPVDAEEQARDLRPARPEEAADAERLATRDLEVDIPHRAPAPEPAGAEERRRRPRPVSCA